MLADIDAQIDASRPKPKAEAPSAPFVIQEPLAPAEAAADVAAPEDLPQTVAEVGDELPPLPELELEALMSGDT